MKRLGLGRDAVEIQPGEELSVAGWEPGHVNWR
jgi:hypothetical protein